MAILKLWTPGALQPAPEEPAGKGDQEESPCHLHPQGARREQESHHYKAHGNRDGSTMASPR